MTSEISELYKKYCRPDMAKLLESIRLDTVFHRARGDMMYYTDENRSEIGVIDFLGGFGSLLFGHNHPDLVNVAIENFKTEIPFSAQGSVRAGSARLSQKLNQFMRKSTGKNFVVTFGNTGTEAVEAAIKHAELSHAKKIEDIMSFMKSWGVLLKQKYRDGEFSVPKSFTQAVNENVGTIPVSNLPDLLSWIQSQCYRMLKKEPVFLCLNRSFHGKTSGSLQLTHNETYRKPFQRIGIKVKFIEPGDTNSLENTVRQAALSYFFPEINTNNELILVEKKYVNIGALFLEPLQGEGGIHPLSGVFLENARRIASENDFPLIFDEIQCGMGRTGTFLFSEQSGVVADYYLLSKSLGGGLSKISALLVRDDLYENEFGTLHTSTFAEDDHSSAIALAALNLLEADPSLMENAKKRGEQIKTGLDRIKNQFPGVIKDVRGEGLMLGIEFMSQEDSGSNFIRSVYLGKRLGPLIAGYLFHEHRIRVAPTLSSHVTIRIEPSFYISFDQCETFLYAVSQLCEILYKQNFYELIKYIVGEEQPDRKSDIRDFRKEQKIGKAPENLRKVAFLGHLIDSEHLKLVDESLMLFNKEQADRFVEKTYTCVPPQVYDQVVVNSLTGEKVALNFIGLQITPQIIEKHARSGDLEPIQKTVKEAVNLAIDLGCQVAGFGGYTSIITRNCQSVITDSIAVTSGNSYTVAMGVEALYKASEMIDIDLSRACMAGVGATGNICSTYLEMMAETVPKIILIIRKGKSLSRARDIASDIYINAFNDIRLMKANGADENSLKGVAKAIYDTATLKTVLRKYETIGNTGNWLLDELTKEMKDRSPVLFSTELSYLKMADLIISASSTPEPVIFPEHLNDWPIVINDIAVPADVDESVSEQKKNVFLIKGGVVKLPFNSDFNIAGIPLETGHAFACMSETILLGLTGIKEHYSYGRISKLKVKKILEIAKIHGFALGQFKTGRSY
ncbi:MAG: aminotransferase class III-fold pyridoxal phosphate-dependent enzyme [Proteobacteria bacterium]|nr:aminotransferase class III-fold pyridoxal phosphate-dependent enzyme [Pseudomonadota bacterium]